jgi:OmpR-family two-component system manganese-sensing response regulator
MFNHSGYEYIVTTASTAVTANHLIDTQDFDLYILDFALPGMSGLELCKIIREKDVNAPILFYTAMTRPIDREQALFAGANEYLVKPNDLEILMETVKRLLDKNTTTYNREHLENLRMGKIYSHTDKS